MSILQYLDQEYLRIQDHLTARVEDLPNLDLETIQNKEALINALVGQNKAYGNHIISLYKTIDATKPLRSPKSSAKSSTDRSNMDLITELQNKIKSYQGIIEDLSNKNLVLLTQVEQLTEHINFKEMKSDHRNVSLTSFSYNGNKFLNSGRVETNQTQQTQRDLSIDVEFFFNNEDFKRATELLTLMDYKQPTNVSTENFNELLIISNKIKDAEMNELLEKLRIVAEAIEIQDQDIRGQQPDESVNISPIDRLFTYIEQKLIKIWSLDQNPGNEELKKSILNSERRLMSFNTKRRQASMTLETEGDYLCPEQLREKVRLLDRDLRQTELELQERTDRLEELEARLNRESGKEECLLNDLENEVKNRLIMEERIQDLANENEELKELFEGVEKENKELNDRVNALHDEIQNKNDDLNRLIEDREQLERESVNMGDFEKLREEFLERGDKIELLTNEIILLKNSQEEKRSLKNGEERVGGIRCPKESLMVESALNMQETLLCNLKQVLLSLKEYLVDTLRNTDDIVLSERIETLDESMDGGANVKNEIRRYIKFNNCSIQNLLKQAYFIKSTAEYILQHSKEKKTTNGLKGLVDVVTIKPFTEGEQEESNNEPEIMEPSNPFRMQLRKDQREISNKLKHAMQSLEDENDLGSKFGSPIEMRNLFDTEYDQKSTFLYEIVALVNRGINKTNDAVSKIKKLADSKDAKALLNNISSQLEDLQTQVNDFANLQGLESSTKNKILTQEKFILQPQPQKENVEEQPKQRPSQRRLNINTGQENGPGLGGKIVNQGFLTPSNRLNIAQSAVTSPEKQQLCAKLLGSPAPIPLIEKNSNGGSLAPKKDDIQRRIQFLEIENKDLKEYKISSEAALKKTHKKLERLNLNFSTEVNALQEEKDRLMLDLEEKQEEVAALAQRVSLLQSLSNEQLSMIQIKDQELAELQDEKKDNQELVRELQVKLSEQVKDMRECSESATQRIDEMNSLQIELAEMTVKCNQLEGEIKDLEKKNKEIMSQSKISTEHQEKITSSKNEMEDKIKKLNEILQITRNELKTCRRLVEEKNSEISQKEEDIKALKDALKKGRNVNKESDIVIHLKNELHAQDDEISTLKHENSDLLQINDLLQNELEKVSNMNRSSVISKRDYRPPVNTIRDGSEELLTLQKSLKMREEPQKLERKTSQNEIACSKRRGSTITVDTKTHENDSRRGSTVYTDLLHTTGGTFVSPNNNSSQTSRSTMRDEREAEIHKLTQRMNELTKTLKTTQTTHHNTYPSFRFINSEQS